jgi:TolA-binding protein
MPLKAMADALDRHSSLFFKIEKKPGNLARSDSHGPEKNLALRQKRTSKHGYAVRTDLRDRVSNLEARVDTRERKEERQSQESTWLKMIFKNELRSTNVLPIPR